MFKFMTKPKINMDSKGFSLVEVLVAVAIISIVSLPLLNSFMVANKVNHKAEVKLAATSVAENAMERAKSIDLASLVLADDGKYYINEDNVDGNGNAFNVQTIIDSGIYSDENSSIWNTEVLNNEKTAIFAEPDTWKGSMVLDVQKKYQSDTVDEILNDPNHHYVYDIVVNIGQTGTNPINERVTVTYYYYYKNGVGLSTEWNLNDGAVGNANQFNCDYSSMVFDYTGDEGILENVLLNYQDDNRLNKIRVINYSNKSVNLILMESGSTKQDTLEVYEWTGLQEEPNLGVWKENSTGVEYKYYECYKSGNIKANEKVGFSNILDSIVDLQNEEFLYSIKVNVYKYVNTVDESVKYNDDIKLTTLDGSKLED